jgi:hypothetical protein
MKNDDEEIGRALAEDILVPGDLTITESIWKGLPVYREVRAGMEDETGVAVGEEPEPVNPAVLLVQEKIVPDITGQFYGRRELHGLKLLRIM